MSDFLSQDQIDALLQQQEPQDGDLSGDSGGDGNGQFEPDFGALTEAFDLFCLQASNVISTLLSRDISFSVAESKAFESDVLQTTIEGPLIVISLSLNGAITGELFLILTKKDVAILSDLMMMGDGSAEYIDDHKDAISELCNQIMGAFTTSLGEHCDDSVSTGAIEVTELDVTNPSFPVENSSVVILKVSIPDIGDSTMAVVLAEESGQQFMDKFSKKTSFGSDMVEDQTGTDIEDITEVSSDLDDAFQDPSYSRVQVDAPKENINMLLDVELDVCIELGKAELSIKRILELAPGSIVELDRMAGEPVDLMVNNKVVAKGEVVVVDENFGIRIVSLVSPEERIKSLR